MVGYERARELVDKIILRQHYLFYSLEILRLVILDPKNFRRGETREGDVAGIRGELLSADRFVEIFRLFYGAAVVPKDGRPYHFVMFI